MIKDINGLSINVENFMVENRMLRKMAGVPDNYGIDLEKIKLHDREKINDYKKLLNKDRNVYTVVTLPLKVNNYWDLISFDC